MFIGIHANTLLSGRVALNMSSEQSAIVSFNLEKVTSSQAIVLELFTEMDDGIGMPLEYKKVAALALLERVLSKKEIHLLAIEADYLSRKAPDIIVDISYYD